MRRYSVAVGRGVSVAGEPEGKTLVFGIYQRNGNVIMFPILDRKYQYFSSIDNTTYKERLSVPISDDHTAYATLNLIGKHLPHQRILG